MKTIFSRSVGTFFHLYILSIFLLVPGYAVAQDIRVFAAASLKAALDHVASDYSTATGQRVTVSYGGSSSLARQISFGAPADIFFSANEQWMIKLEQSGYIENHTRRNLLSNQIVLVSSSTEPPLDDIEELPLRLAERRLVMAQVDAVPAGIYGKSALEYFGLWSLVSGRVAQTDSVRAALALVASGAVPFGIVYSTDASADQRVTIAFAFPEQSHPKVVYPVTAIKGRLSPKVEDFMTYLTSDAALARYKEQGFIPLDPVQ